MYKIIYRAGKPVNVTHEFDKYLLTNKDIENTDTFDMSDVFSICHLVVVEETFGSRLSTKRGYVYATQKLKNFLTQNREFTVQKFVEHFSTTSSTAAKALTRLLKNGLIQKTR